MEARGQAIVTGAGRGLGRAIALELARRGFDVVAGMRTLDAEAGLLSQAARLRGAIVCRRMDVNTLVDTEFPDDLRVVVNNAGVDTAYLPVEHAPVDEWRAAFETNFFGALAVMQAAIPVLRRAGGGVICNVTSAALLFPMPLYGAYRASKAALSALGESLAAEVAGFGIRVLEIQPGPIDTDMLAASAREPEASRFDEYRDLALRAHVGRLAVGGQTTPATDAAAAIVDAIMDDESALRATCDPVGSALRDNRDSMGDAQWQRTMSAAFAPKRG
jgi:NAD(P)-dependent dehydrogenase (short-subunit alcohol dehydrogenase family)